MKKRKISNLIFFLGIFLSSCIENDVPYPYMPANILAFTVEGQVGSTDIDTDKKRIYVSINDLVDIQELRITQLNISKEALLIPDTSVCLNYKKFPNYGFESINELPSSADTRINFSKPVSLLLKTYQDYFWTIEIQQIFQRTIEVENQVGNPIIDVNNKQVIVYVSKDQPLNDLKVKKMELGGTNSLVVPDPTKIKDYSNIQKFISCRLDKYYESWTVIVLHSSSTSTTGAAEAWARKAKVYGGIQEGLSPEIEYKKSVDSEWTKLPKQNITVNKSSFEALITGLDDGTDYVWRPVVEGTIGQDGFFSTEKIQEIPNLNFDTWTFDDKNWYPNSVSSNFYWSTGNEGVTSGLAGNKEPNSRPESVDVIKGKAARLTTLGGVTAVGVAAGNLFIGTYKTNGLNPGKSVNFGRPFSGARPTRLSGWYKYTSKPIDHEGIPVNLKQDQCHIYIWLKDATEKQIAYGEFVSDKTISTYEKFSINLKYSNLEAKPAYIAIVATSSRYGGDFEGMKVVGAVGSGSELLVDEFELHYD